MAPTLVESELESAATGCEAGGRTRTGTRLPGKAEPLPLPSARSFLLADEPACHHQRRWTEITVPNSSSAECWHTSKLPANTTTLSWPTLRCLVAAPAVQVAHAGTCAGEAVPRFNLHNVDSIQARHSCGFIHRAVCVADAALRVLVGAPAQHCMAMGYTRSCKQWDVSRARNKVGVWHAMAA